MEPVPALATPRLVLTIPPPDAAPRLLAYVVENEHHLARWEPPRPEGFFTDAFWRRRIEKNHDEFARDVSARLTIFRRHEPEGRVIGHVNFSNVVRGAFQACTLGYSLDHRFEGQGLMLEALQVALAYAFDVLHLHRVMANYIPTNERSGRLLRRLGFTVEGYARDYLFIHDRWRDHVLTAITNPSPEPPPP